MGSEPPDEDADFEALLDAYLDAPAERNDLYGDVVFDWIEDREEVGALHMASAHRVSKEEVEQVIRETPPRVEAKRSRDAPGRTLFWGATRADRWLFISCEDLTEGGRRVLRPITAYEPEEGEDYWRRQ